MIKIKVNNRSNSRAIPRILSADIDYSGLKLISHDLFRGSLVNMHTLKLISRRFHQNLVRSALNIVLLMLLLTVAGDQKVYAQTRSDMQMRFDTFLATQTADSLPFTLRSTEQGGAISTSVETFLEGIPFPLFAERLSRVEEWCEFVPLHLNIKACLHEVGDDISKLGFYVGVKGYLAPDKADLLLLDFQSELIDDVLKVNFWAKSGPLGSSNYDFRIRAIEADGGIYFEFDLSSEPGLLANVAKLYLATVARSKIGFSRDGTSWTGKPKFVRGQRGGAERNIVRYLLSIKAYFATLDIEPENQRYQERLTWWFDLTQVYPEQLYEMSKGEYIDIKLRERKNQHILLESLQRNTIPVYDIPSENR
jgi:hypothetical protein